MRTNEQQLPIRCPFYSRIGVCRNGGRCSRQHNRPTISPTLLFANMYHQRPRDINDNDEDPMVIQEIFEDFYEDIFEELSKFGDIQNLVVCDNVAPHLFGNVYVKFKDQHQAAAAFTAFNGRLYCGQPILAEFSPVWDFPHASCRQFEEENNCHRGGYCNFIHAKHVGRALRRKLFGGTRNPRNRSVSPYFNNRTPSYLVDRQQRGGSVGGGNYYANADRDAARSSYDNQRDIRVNEYRPWRTASPVRESSEERRAKIERWNREREARQ
ncbi:Splicing factor u2af small subunit a [Thalictrum thalictroides]|uniref:Splicing factor u2af small subunit a n=1 Tax=Thalictrum thalictroides TaxID=46969 RepID=A0A7J6WJD7_THATH|nr:Splicing factor u2af small subunit a [Thalictrum thalictroides]